MDGMITEISFKNQGYVNCKSRFYTAQDILSSSQKYVFQKGVNRLSGDIDGHIWAASYLVSMYQHRHSDFTLFELPEIIVNNQTKCSLDEICNYSCYLDPIHPLFSKDKSIKRIVSENLKRNPQSTVKLEDIPEFFSLDAERYNRSILGTGNEIFQAMVAIGYSCGKQIYCFPWMSKSRYQFFQPRLDFLLQKLQELDAMIIMPVGN